MKYFRITILFTVLMSMFGIKTFAHDIEVANKDGVIIYYNWINDNTELSVTYQGDDYYWSLKYSGNVVIPESVEYEGKTYSVTQIGDKAFLDCSGLTSVAIPNSVTTIDEEAFRICSGLTSIVVEDGNTAYDSRENCNAIIEKSSNTLVAGCQNTTIPNSVTSIGEGAFSGCSSLTSLTIPSSVTSIGESAFFGCSGLTSIIIPNSVTSIGEEPFSLCSSLTSIIVEDGNTAYDSRENCNAIIEKSSNTLVAGCQNTTIPNSVTSIGRFAFYECSGLTSVSIPNSVTSIGECAYYGCSGLTSVTIPNSVTSIGRFAFYECSGLASVTFGNSVTSIGNYAFMRCTALNEIICKADTPPTCGDRAFDIDKSACKLYVPKGHKTDYQAADQWKEFTNIEEEESSGTTEDEITIKDIGKTTWCSKYDLDFTNVAGIKAYTATGYDDIDKTIWLTRVMKVPAGTGLLVKGDAGTYKIPHVNVRAYYTNMLVGNVGEAIKIEETDGDKTNYYLSGKDGTFVSVNGNANIGKNKAYLQLPTSVFAGTRSIGISYDDEDGTTGIKNLAPVLSEGEGAWYTLQGQRVAKPGKGLYIRNGKKVIVR